MRTAVILNILQDVSIIGIDPNPEMDPYAIKAADAAGLAQSQIQILQGVAEQMPIDDQSQDAVVCTLVCAVVLQILVTMTATIAQANFVEHSCV